MESVLCICLGESHVTSMLIQKNECGTGYEAHCERRIPLSSLCFLDDGSLKFAFGIDSSNFTDIIPHFCVLRSLDEFLRRPLLFDESESGRIMRMTFSFVASSENQTDHSHLPLYYLLCHLRDRYISWSHVSLDTIVLCCSLDYFISYSFLIGECMKECGFTNCHVIDSTSLLGYAVMPSASSKSHSLILNTGIDTSHCLLFSTSSKLGSYPLWEECPYLTVSSLISQFQNSLFPSEPSESFESLHTSLSKLRWQSEHGKLSHQILAAHFKSFSDSLVSTFSKCMASRKLEFQNLDRIVITGELANPPLLQQIQSLYPHIPAVLVENDAMEREGLLRFCSLAFVASEKGAENYVGEMEGNVPSGYGEQYRFGECVYRGFFKNGLFEGIGESLETNQVIYRGQFQRGRYHGRGVLSLGEDEVIRGVFANGELVDGSYDTCYGDGAVRYRGPFKRGKRNGVGKEFRRTGELLYEGCFQDGEYCGLGRLYVDGEHYVDGTFVRGKLEGEGSVYSREGRLCSVGMYREGRREGAGREFDANGYLVYEGTADENGFYGKGVLYYPGSGIRYDGEFLHGKFSGYGQLYNKEGDLLYIGEFQNGLFEGEGKEYTQNTILLYAGAFHQGLRHGRGKLFFSEGHFYEGSFANGELTGTGRMVWADGQSYEGEFQNGRKEGEGVFVWSDSSRYEGHFARDQREGFGKQFDSRGKLVYEGEWREGLASGTGKLFFSSGSVYDGEVVCGKRSGKGKQLSEDGKVEYEGDWKDDVPHGFGTYYYVEGNVYTGQWVNGEKEGTGRMNYTDGSYYIGCFKGGVRSGKGCIVSKQGKILKEYLK